MSGRTGQILGNYRIEAQLGTGGMGVVYRGVHVLLNRPAAVKILHTHLAANPGFQARFQQEARASASLNHPHIVQVYDFGAQDDLNYLVMELIDDGSLRDLLSEASRNAEQWRAWRLGDGLDLVRQAAEGLAAAHAVGMIHRDIKPDNLLVKHGIDTGTGKDEYTVKIADFGLARLAEGTHLTATGAMIGTPAYMSPEQVQGMELDGRSDIYSLGLILYEVVTGRLPFEAKTPTEAIFKHVYTEPVSPRHYEPELSNDLEAIILRCLAKQPDQRYASAAELARELRHAMQQPVEDTGTSRPVEELPTPAPGLAPRDMLGMRLNRYELLTVLPSGGMAHVFKARHVTLDRDVAIKILRPEYAVDQNFVQRFIQEARIAAPLQHPNVVEIFDTGVVNGVHYIAMEYVEGESLRQLLDVRRPTNDEVVTWIRQVAGALDYAHAHGIIHRDIKPANIMIRTDGTALLLDFGIAKLAEEIALNVSAVNLTVAGMVIGTPAYLAPERAADVPITPQADIYSLGCVTYEMLTGTAPFAGNSFASLVESHRSQAPRPAHELNPAVPPAVSNVLAQAMAKEPSQRFPSARAFADALAAASHAPAVAAPVAGVLPQTSTPAAQSPTVAAPPAEPPGVPPATATGGVSWFRWWYGAVAGVVLAGVVLGFFLLDGGGGGGGDNTATATDQVAAVTSTGAAGDATATSETGGVDGSATAETSDPVLPLPPERIAWVSGRVGNSDVPELFITDVGSGEEVHLSSFFEDPVSAWSPAWYPDGLSLSFVSNQAGNDDIWIVDADGANLLQLTDDAADDQYPAWSPDGREFAFQSMRDGNWEIYVASADGSELRNISNTPNVDWGPNWSPDGQWITFISNRDGNDDVWVMRPDGSEARNLTTSPDAESNPVWSPNGAWIAFGRAKGDESNIWLMRPDGSEQHQLTDDPAADSNPTWSPDGEQIAFSSERDGDRNIYIMDVADPQPEQITNDPFYDGAPAWSPYAPRGPNLLGAVESWVAYGGSGNLDQLAQFDLDVIDAQPGRSYSAEEIAELQGNGSIVLSYLNVGACESFRPYFSTCEANMSEAVPGNDGEYFIDITNAEMQAALLAYADELANAGVTGFYLGNVDVAATRNQPELAEGVIAFIGALRDRYPDSAIVLESRDLNLLWSVDSSGRPVHWLVDAVTRPELSRSLGDGFAAMPAEERTTITRELYLLQAQRLMILTLDAAADENEACEAFSYGVEQDFIPYIVPSGNFNEISQWSCATE